MQIMVKKLVIIYLLTLPCMALAQSVKYNNRLTFLCNPRVWWR